MRFRLGTPEIVVARGFIGKFGKVLADGNFKFSVQGARSPPQFGNFNGKSFRRTPAKGAINIPTAPDHDATDAAAAHSF